MNTGFGLGCMLSLNNSARKYLAFVNSDTFFDQDCFTPLIEFLSKNPNAAVITPQHKDAFGNITRSFSRFDSFGSRFIGSWISRIPLRTDSRSTLIKSPVKTVDFIFGSFMLVKRDAFAKVGGFDPSIFLYYEEMDLCLRLKKSGFTTHFYPEVSFNHIGNGSTGGVNEVLRFESLLSMIYVMRKHRGVIYGLVFYITLVLQLAIKAAFKGRNRRMFINVLKAYMPQACSHRLSQPCSFIDDN
jgi:GT2 family glycosyltransferase